MNKNSLNILEDSVEFTTVVLRVPFKKTTSANDLCAYDWRDIIGSFSDVLINALTDRLNALITNVCEAQIKDRIISSDKNIIVYRRGNGSVVNFYTNTYNIINSAIACLKSGNWNEITPPMYNEMLKAIIWIKNPDITDDAETKKRRFFRWSDCIDILITRSK